METIKLRIDVDYPYPSRVKSFLATALRFRVGRDYLRNAKIIAKMINSSHREVRAYWFFTPQTVPDREMLRLMRSDRHEVGLHVANDPYKEWKVLEEAVERKITYYTVHGTERLLARLMWRRRLWEDKAHVPKDFPLKSFYVYPTWGLDVACHAYSEAQAKKMALENIAEGKILHVHPEWLFQRGKINRRGPYYVVLKSILGVDRELDTLVVRRKGFIRVGSDAKEYEKDIAPTNEYIEKLGERGIDVFTFIERKWCGGSYKLLSENWTKVEDNIALLQISSYDNWWKNIGKKTRNMVRKAEKSGVITRLVEPSKELAEGIWKIYNETPVRQDRAFPHYGESLQNVMRGVFSARNCTFIGAYIESELVGFIQLVYGDKTAVIAQILSLQRHLDKAVNNALIAKVVELCAAKGMGWVMYGRMGNHPSLDRFKESNGFIKFPLTRYYVPLTRKGRFAVRFGLHREFKDVLPEVVKYRLIPFYNWVSRTKLRVKLWFHPKRLS
ncbi:MAG: GNAT family N-acetyltransferase [Candidatus Bathyarchaeia archaeon]